MPTVSVNSPNGLLDQIGPDATHQIGPDEANHDCPDGCADHGRRNGPESCDACLSGPHIVHKRIMMGHMLTLLLSAHLHLLAKVGQIEIVMLVRVGLQG
ncbi:hypothetical protein ACFX2B_006361 [Malus domestica]